MFPGGTHPHEGVNGKAVNSGNAIRELPAPARVVIPLSQHIGAPCKPIVQRGDLVLAGQKIGEAGGFVSAPVHSSVSGKVVGIEPVELANGSTVSAVVIENDFQNNWVELHPAEHPETLTAQELQTIVREAGIVGMGGATFPTQVKITPPKGKTIEKLVINGAECEPYLTADHRLMLEKPAEIIDGIHLMMLALDVKEAHVGVENNKMDAVEALRAAAKNVEGITIHDLPVRYPQGGEKQLVYALTRRKVPTGGLPLDVGCVVSNVGTVYAIQQAIREGRPLVQRVTTVGGLVNNPGNFLVSVGTPIDTLLEACGGMQSGARMLISGGPMMGMAITRTDIPVTKGTSGVLVLGEEAVDPVESACINCGRCLRACPMQLMPTLLDRCVRADRYDEAEKYGIAFIHQELNIWPNLSILENLFLMQNITNSFGMLDFKKMRRLAEEKCGQIGITLPFDAEAGECSVGQQQMTEIMRNLMLDAKVVIMDEPTAALTERETEKLFAVMHALKDKGVAIVYISHRMEEVFAHCDTITVMRDGYAISSKPTRETNMEQVVRDMVGRSITEYYPGRTNEPGEIVLEVKTFNVADNVILAKEFNVIRAAALFKLCTDSGSAHVNNVFRACFKAVFDLDREFDGQSADGSSDVFHSFFLSASIRATRPSFNIEHFHHQAAALISLRRS